MTSQTPPPNLEYVLELKVTVGPTLVLGAGSFGVRRTVAITGGAFSGAIAGRVLPGGADWQFVESDGTVFLEAQYVIETEDGTRIEVRNQGVRHGPQSVMTRLAAGEPVSPAEYYFRTTPRFFPPAGKYDWLKRSVFVGVAERFTDVVCIRIWQVL